MNTFLLDIDMSVLKREYFGVELSHYVWALGIILFTILLKKTLTSVVMRISSRIVSGSAYAEHREKIKSTLFLPFQHLLQIVLYNLATNQFNERFDKISIYHLAGKKMVITLGDAIDHAFLLLFIIYLAQSLGGLIELVYFLRLKTARDENNHGRQQLLPLMKEVSKLLLWTLCTFWILGSVFHVNVPALITGLGIGGVAIALAGKATVENFFAAFTLLSDKPFQVGDIVKLGELEGSVEQIGFRSTHLRRKRFDLIGSGGEVMYKHYEKIIFPFNFIKSLIYRTNS
jgi:MscS family membrane protein